MTLKQLIKYMKVENSFYSKLSYRHEEIKTVRRCYHFTGDKKREGEGWISGGILVLVGKRQENGGKMKRGSREGEAATKRRHWT